MGQEVKKHVIDGNRHLTSDRIKAGSTTSQKMAARKMAADVYSPRDVDALFKQQATVYDVGDSNLMPPQAIVDAAQRHLLVHGSGTHEKPRTRGAKHQPSAAQDVNGILHVIDV